MPGSDPSGHEEGQVCGGTRATKPRASLTRRAASRVAAWRSSTVKTDTTTATSVAFQVFHKVSVGASYQAKEGPGLFSILGSRGWRWADNHSWMGYDHFVEKSGNLALWAGWVLGLGWTDKLGGERFVQWGQQAGSPEHARGLCGRVPAPARAEAICHRSLMVGTRHDHWPVHPHRAAGPAQIAPGPATTMAGATASSRIRPSGRLWRAERRSKQPRFIQRYRH